MSWKEVLGQKRGEILSHWESEEGSMLTITKGFAHIVHQGMSVAYHIPEELASTDSATIAKTVIRMLNPSKPVTK